MLAGESKLLLIKSHAKFVVQYCDGNYLRTSKVILVGFEKEQN